MTHQEPWRPRTRPSALVSQVVPFIETRFNFVLVVAGLGVGTELPSPASGRIAVAARGELPVNSLSLLRHEKHHETDARERRARCSHDDGHHGAAANHE